MRIPFYFILLVSFSKAAAQTQPRLVLPIGHTSYVNSAVFSPNRKYVFTASDDNTGRNWDAANGKELQELNGHTDELISAKFSPDGKYLVTTSLDSTTRKWDFESGNAIYILKVNTKEIKSAIQFKFFYARDLLC